MNNKKYWEERANLRMATYHKNSNETILKINKAYDKAISDINKDIKKIFNKFKLNNELTPSEAKDLLNSKISIKEIEDIRAKINYIQDEDIKKYLRAKLDSGAYKARITRLEALKESININIAQVADIQLRDINTLFIDNIEQAYYSTMYDIQKGIGIGFSFAEMPTSRIKEILKQDWSGKHYSERVWKNNEVLAQKLQETLLSGFMSGKSYRRMAKELEDLSDLGKFASERLIRTECTYIANQGELESYKECGIEKYVYVAILDLRTSEICRELDNKIFLVKEAMPGKNLPPMHPYCRSTTYAYMGKEWYEDIKRKARDPKTGELYTLPKNMSYKEWYQKFVVEKHGKDKADTMEKMIKNKSSDRKQYEEYKKVLGKDVPKSLKEFQEMKYNNSTKWNELKSQYRINNASQARADLYIVNVTNENSKIDVIVPRNIYKELNKSEIGRETIKYIEENNLNIQLYYENVPKGIKGICWGEKQIEIYVPNTKTKVATAQTLIHEVTHLKYNIRDTQWAETVCFLKEIEHTNGKVTIKDKRETIELVKKLYPEYPWR